MFACIRLRPVRLLWFFSPRISSPWDYNPAMLLQIGTRQGQPFLSCPIFAKETMFGLKLIAELGVARNILQLIGVGREMARIAGVRGRHARPHSSSYISFPFYAATPS